MFFSVFSHLRTTSYWVVFIGDSWAVDWGFRASTMIGLSTFVDVNNIKRGGYRLQITLCALCLNFVRLPLSSYDWFTQKSKDNTSFLYWKCVIDLQIKVLLYVCSICEGNFKLHVEALYKNYYAGILYMIIINMLDGWRYIDSTFIPLKRNFPMFTTSFRKETFRSKSVIGSFQ